MDVRKDTRGFSLVELIITMGIMAVFAGAILGAMGYINAGKTKKASAKLNNQIAAIQTATMTRKGQTFLYIYRTSNGIYCTSVSTETDTNHDTNPDYSENETNPDLKYGFSSRSALENYMGNLENGTKICDSTVTITGKKGAGGGAASVTLSESNMLKIGYSKATGAFTYSNDGSFGTDSTDKLKDVDFYSEIVMSGKETFTIKMVQATGKHFVKES